MCLHKHLGRNRDSKVHDKPKNGLNYLCKHFDQFLEGVSANDLQLISVFGTFRVLALYSDM